MGVDSTALVACVSQFLTIWKQIQVQDHTISILLVCPFKFLDLPPSLVLRFENVRESLGKFLFGVIHVL